MGKGECFIIKSLMILVLCYYVTKLGMHEIRELPFTMELLAPAGNLEKLKYAVAYGADAVYFGMEFGSLRSYAGNFTLADAETGLAFLHEHGKKGYVTLNIYPYSDELSKLVDIAAQLDALGVEAFIVSDLGVLSALKKYSLKAALHISTQANTTNYQAALAYKALGASRVNLARELSLEQLETILSHTAGQIETEVFVHGAVCFSYSGRCAISDYLTGQKANRGECKHPCRWKYAVMEETRPGRYLPVGEDQRGLYLFNSSDLALFEYIPMLKNLGVDAVKIEGRMKSIHYIATAVSFYRQVLDGRIFSREEGFTRLQRAAHRGFSTGFIKGHVDDSDYQRQRSVSSGQSTIVGNIDETSINGRNVIEVRNTIHAGEELEVLNTDGCLSRLTMPRPMVTTTGEMVERANHSQLILLDQALTPYTILRRVQEQTDGQINE